MPKKYVGRFTKIEEKEAPIYGTKKIDTNVDGVEYLKEGAGVTSERLLTDADLKRIKVKRMKEAVKKVDRKGFASSSSGSYGSSDDEGEG